MHPSKPQSTAELTLQKGGDVYITRKQKQKYQDTEILRKYLSRLKAENSGSIVATMSHSDITWATA